MIDGETLAHAVCTIRNSTSVTVKSLASEINISEEQAFFVIDRMVDRCLLIDFGGFYAVDDLAELN